MFVLLLGWYVARYGDCASFFFHFDDFWVLGDASGLAGVLDIFRTGEGHFLLYRPLSTVGYFWVLQSLFGYDAAPYHATQLLAHVVNAFLVYGVASLVLRSRWLGLGAAAVYAAAPGHAIAVYWIALYTMTGTVCWYLACLWLWIGGLEHDRRRGPSVIDRLRPALCFVLFLGALLSSEHGVTLPLALAGASVLLARATWKSTLWRLSPFFLVAFAYAVAKVAYMRYGFDADFPDPLTNFVIRQQYQPAIDPVASVRLLGFYLGCTLGWLYDPATDAAKWYGVGAGMMALITLSAWRGRRTDRGRQVLFGLLLFVIPLGPVLLLPAHASSYYVGTAAAGLAIAVMAGASAIPRFRCTAPVVLVALVLAGEVLVGEPTAKASADFRFFRDFQAGALSWLDTIDTAAQHHPGVREMLVSSDPVTELIFRRGHADRLFLGAAYDVRVVKNVAAEPATGGQEIVSQARPWQHGTNYPGRRPQWDWLRRTNPWQRR